MKKILIIGDIFKDTYIVGDVKRISPEAPVPIVDKKSEYSLLGGASNVAKIVEANHPNKSVLIGSVSSEEELFFQPNFINIPKRITNTKIRILNNGVQLLRIDNEEKDSISIDQILSCLSRLSLEEFEYVIFSDYNKGMFSSSSCTELIKFLNDKNLKVIVDVKDKFSKYEGAFIIKCNNKEYESFYEPTNSIIIRTEGPLGCTLFLEDNVIQKFSTEEVKVKDVTGAGDSFIAALTLALNNGSSLEESIDLGVKAGTSSVRFIGNYTPILSSLKNRLIFTNGCFDVLHLGHIALLKYAESLGERLVVGINSDSSIKKLKGISRPINDQNTRKKTLELLGYEVIIFEEDTPLSLIENLKPDVIVKGSDYSKEEVVGNTLSEVKLFPLVEGLSTTNLINKLQNET